MNERMAPATEYFAAITIPSHILGVIFGLVIFGLGVAKGTSPAIVARKVEVV